MDRPSLLLYGTLKVLLYKHPMIEVHSIVSYGKIEISYCQCNSFVKGDYAGLFFVNFRFALFTCN